MAEIVGVHGVKGELKVRSYAENPSLFQPGGRILVEGTRTGGQMRTINWVRPHKQLLLFSLEGLEDRGQAEELIGAEILVAREQLPEPEEGTYYWCDILGLRVYGEDDVYLGCVREIVPTGSNDVYVVTDGARETLVPALQSVILDVDLRAGRMRVRLPDGL
ncbi:MAG: ribosome maturation factor RimM [Thermodesulfobacteriota bacterium]